MIKKLQRHNIITSIIAFSLLLISFNSCMGKDPQVKSSNSEDGNLFKAIKLSPSRSVPLYGFNGNNIKGPVWSTPGLLEQIKSLNMQIIRYPGGTVSDWWDWRTGWFINNPNVPKKLRDMKPSPYGLDELKKLTDATGCQVIFTLNITSSTQSEQIEMLKTAQKMGIPVKYVELGNEANLKESAGMKKFKGPSLYGDASKSWMTVLKQNFPGVQVAVVGGNKNSSLKRVTANRASLESNDWNKVVLDKNPTVNGIVMHVYTKPDKILDQSGINFQDLYEQFQDLYDKEGFRKVNNRQVWITEYNIHWTFKGMDRKQAQNFATSWGQALGIILMTSSATNISPQVSVLLNHNLTQSPVFAAINTENPSFPLLPNGIGMQAWLKAAKGASQMQKIVFANDNNKEIEDYKLLGWVFSDGNQKKTIIVNLTAAKKNIGTDNVIPTFSKAEALFADKNKQIFSEADVNRKSITINKSTLELPAYSVTILE